MEATNCLKPKTYEALKYEKFPDTIAETLVEINVLCPYCYDEGPGYCEECWSAGTQPLEVTPEKAAELQAGSFTCEPGEWKERPLSREEIEWNRGDYLRDCAKDDKAMGL